MDLATFDCPTVAYVEEPVLVAQLGIWSADGVLEIATVEGDRHRRGARHGGYLDAT